MAKLKGGSKRVFDLITKEGWKPVKDRRRGVKRAFLVKDGKTINARFRHVQKAVLEIQRRSIHEHAIST